MDREPRSRGRGLRRDGSRLVVMLAVVVLAAPAIAGFGASVAVSTTPAEGPTATGGPGDGLSDGGADPAWDPRSVAASPTDSQSAAETGGSELFADPDGDGLATIVEQRLGTDPHDADTDGDGLPDGAEVTCDSLPGADPLHQDLYLEVDSESGESLPDGAVERAEASFADAPVSNPDGQSGIDLHVRRDDTDLTLGSTVDTREGPGPADDIGDVTDDHRDYGENGHYYVLLADDVAYDGEAYYVGAGQPGVVMLEPYDDAMLTASLLVHELGHAFGFDESLPGVDSEDYSLDEYPSVMNYNGLYKSLNYSDGSGELNRDEWAFIANDRHRPPVTCGPNETRTSLS